MAGTVVAMCGAAVTTVAIIVAFLLSLGLVIFLATQTREAYVKDGARAAVAMFCSATLLLPLLLLLETLEWTIWRPRLGSDTDDNGAWTAGEQAASTRPLQLNPGQVAWMEGLVRHFR